MRQSSLNTKQVYDLIRDQLDDLRLNGALQDVYYQRKSTPARVLEALNNADIDCCGYLDLEITAVAFVPSGVSEFNLFSQDRYAYNMVQGIADSTEVDPLSLSNFLNNRVWVNFGKLNSGYMYAYNVPPLGGVEATKRYRVVSEDQYNSKSLQDQFDDYNDGLIYVDPVTGRARIKGAVSGNTYFTWNATLMPYKMDIIELKSDSADVDELISSYSISTPFWAKDMLINKAMISLLPVVSEARQFYLNDERRAMEMAMRNRPNQVSTFRPVPYLGPA